MSARARRSSGDVPAHEARRAFLTGTLLLALGACAPADTPNGAAEPATRQGDTAAPAPPVAIDTSNAPGQERLLAAAGAIVAFLRGAAPLDTSLLGDTVTLYVAPEGGGESRAVPAAALRAREAWRIGTRSLLPFAGKADLSARAGVHYNCHEYPLASRYPELAAQPHASVRLQAPGAAGCLGAWNMTFVFAGSDAPRLMAAVYDQWEW